MFSANRKLIEPGKDFVIIYLLIIGFISILGQVVILRELNVAFFGIELIYILSIGFWLIGTAIGASAGKKSSYPKEQKIGVFIFFTAILLIIDILFIRGIRIIFGGVPGGFLPFFTQLIGLGISLLPISFLCGLLFQWAAKRFALENETLAKAYAVESAGGVLGGLASTLFLYFGVQNFSIAIICSLCSFGVIVFYSWQKKINAQKYIFSAVFIAVFVMLGTSRSFDKWTTSWNYPNLLESNDTPYGRVTITSLESQVSVFEDDALSYETESIGAEEFVQLSMLQTTKFDNVLVLGGGFAGIISELQKLPIKKIDYVEINENLIETIKNHLPLALRNSLTDKRVKIIYEDPRQFLHQDHSYDAIIVGMPEPTSAQSNRFYTKEFFESCSKHIGKDGILTFRIRSAENLWTPQLQKRNKSIYAALNISFNKVIVLPGTTNIFIASQAALTSNPQILIDRFNERNLQTKLVSPQFINYVYTNDRFTGIEKILSTGTTIPNSDLHPACYGYTMSIWLSKFFSELTLPDINKFRFNSITNSVIFWVVIAFVSFIIINKKLKAVRRFILVALTGFIGMILETLLILNYQSKSGILFQDIGILLTAFMVGLALGAFIINKVVTHHNFQEKKYSWSGIILLLGFVLLSIAIYYLIKFELLNDLLSTSFILIFTGIFVSAVFAFISITETADPNKIMIHLYSADLVGGSLGSLIASLILIPVYGILTTAIIMAVAAVLTLVFLL